MAHFRSDFIRKFETYENPQVFLNYIYYANNHSEAPGEDAFQALKIPFAYAKLPLIERFERLDAILPVSFVYGKQSWMCLNSPKQIKMNFPKRNIEIYYVSDAGHHVMLDNEIEFNEVMIMIYKKIENNKRI